MNKRTGHKLKISDGKGSPINLVEDGATYAIHDAEAERVRSFITEVGHMIGLQYIPERWNWAKFSQKILRKGMLSGDAKVAAARLNNGTYTSLFRRNPFSLAMTASNRVEYSLE